MKGYKDVEKGMCKEEFGVFKGCVEVSFSFLLSSRLLVIWGRSWDVGTRGEGWKLTVDGFDWFGSVESHGEEVVELKRRRRRRRNGIHRFEVSSSFPSLSFFLRDRELESRLKLFFDYP